VRWVVAPQPNAAFAGRAWGRAFPPASYRDDLPFGTAIASARRMRNIEINFRYLRDARGFFATEDAVIAPNCALIGKHAARRKRRPV
jgi:hypothetical protein